jgi:DNA-binding response OmpR family regulator
MYNTSPVLIIDNDRAIVDLIVEVLTDEGYIAYSTFDGAGALATIVRHPPALILLDMRMPGVSGPELIVQLRDSRRAPIPIVLITATPCDAAALLVPGSIECLAKPFDIDDLLACVARYVQPAQGAEQPSACCAICPA